MTPCIDCTLLTDNVTTVDGRTVARCGACGTEEAESAVEVALIPVPEGAKWPSVAPRSVTGASFARNQSKQDYATPENFMAAAREKFGPMDFDLAASMENAKAPRWYDVAQDSLSRDWSRLAGNLWLNPPFGNIAPWALKCAASRVPGRILLLVPASVGSKWWAEDVDGVARVYFLRPRLSFDGKAPFPKDCALCVYGAHIGPDYSCWKWR